MFIGSSGSTDGAPGVEPGLTTAGGEFGTSTVCIAESLALS